ncbi:hypothetical protein GCM10007424_04770 [Flavobacterium suaedae]|uniref:DUF1569 domain-containing protein n=1 Tax=Flavobacterium suaedae TaxID=1767027 RepID=A0ABQ1JJE1_9FLAO|nr:DUF1569 domain-containing protein [Flavobacterium suaedae]GGB67832.1 hypothetical protein GCM10007424_04770 [Flavobacterium suaedae]
MESIFDQQGNQNIIARIEKLTPSTPAKWGKMTVSQMLVHCQQPIKVCYGTLKLKSGIMAFLFGKMIKKKIGGPKPFKQDLPTVKEFVVANDPDFETSQKELIDLVKVFAEKGHDAIVNPKHPFFGEMTMDEWNELQWKHLDHHLRQFGV